MLQPLYRWIWRDPGRRAQKLLSFAVVEADGGRDLVRAAELTRDPLLRRLYLAHAVDESRHAGLFRDRGSALLNDHPANATKSKFQAEWLAPGERGLDDLRIERQRDGALLAFLHLSEGAAARSFARYRDALPDDPATRELFEKVLRDEEFHMNYTRAQLSRVEPDKQGMLLWRARLGRLWKGYLRVAVGLAGVISGLVLRLVYFILLPPFALLAKRAESREPEGWRPASRGGRVARGGPGQL
jgi:rubrerythrin